MDSSAIIFAMILACLALIALMAFAGPIKFLLRSVLNAGFGAAGIIAVNSLLGFAGVEIGINLLTMGFVAFLGVPGFLAIIFMSIIL